MPQTKTIEVAFNDTGIPCVEVDPEAELNIRVNEEGTFEITGNRTGLRLLARSALGMAECERTDGYHIHLDDLYELNRDGNHFIVRVSES